MQKLFVILPLALAISGAVYAAPPVDIGQDMNATGQPPVLGVVWARGVANNRASKAIGGTANARRTPLMTYHGGKIMTSVVSKNIFWGPSWGNGSTAFAGDKITGLNAWYSRHGASRYATTVDEWTDTVNGGHTVGNAHVHQGAVIDTSTASGGAQTATILAEVCKQVTAGNIVPDAGGNGYYAVYTDVKRGSAGYCAWHSAGSCGGKALQFAFFWNLDGDSGCDPADSGTQHSQGLEALVNVTAHELEEARSDPASPGAWYDSSGNENADKCGWTFGGSETFTDGNTWKMQREWSNVAYNSGTGKPNSSGQNGCINGLGN